LVGGDRGIGPQEPPIKIQQLHYFISGRYFKIVIQRNQLFPSFPWYLLVIFVGDMD